jgi:glycosyltransferase involved in cell wall biosynthesis
MPGSGLDLTGESPVPVSVQTIVLVQATSEIGGSDVYGLRLVSYLDKAKFRVVVVLPRQGPLVDSLQAAGAEVVILPMRQLRPVWSMRYQAAFVVGFLPSVLRLVNLIRARRAAIVHSKSLLSVYGPFAALLARVPNIQHLGELPDYPRPIVWMLTTAVLLLSQRVLTSSEAVATGLFGSPDRRSRKVMAIVDGVEVDRFRPDVSGAGVRAGLGVPESAPLVGFVSRLDPWKGVEVFLRAAAIVAAERSDVRFAIWGGSLPGHDAYGVELLRLASELDLGGRLTFAGWSPPARMPEVMAALDLLVHTSVKPEPLGLGLVEAMASGRPVVASRAGGVLETVLDGETGRLVAPGDVAGVAGAVLELLADPVRARGMGEAGRRRATALFDMPAHARSVEAVYAELLTKP